MPQLPLGATLGHVLDGVLPRATRVTLEGRVTRFVRGESGDPTWGAGALVLREPRVKVPFVGHYLPTLRAGMVARLAGVREDHEEHGPQLYVQDVVSASLPLEPEAVAAYLAANIDGLGPSRAKTVTDVLGRAAITRLLADPDLIAGAITGLRGQKLAAATHIWAARVAEEGAGADVEARLMAAGLGQKLARRVVRFFASPALGAIVAAEAPYRLLAVPGMGWQRTDAVAQHLGVALDAPVRLVAAAESALRDAMGEGHSCLPRAALARAIRPLVGGGVTDAAIEAALDRAEEGGRIARSADLLYLPEVLEAEWRIADAVATLVARPAALTSAQREVVRPIIEARVHVGTPDERDVLSPAQRRAVWLGLEHGLAILTGRPGAGKTSTVAVYLDACAALGWSVAVAAPTGKAAARVKEVAPGVDAGTLHRLIGGPPGHYRDHPLDADVIVVDETSMCSTETLAWLLMNVNTARTRVLLVGDPAQLPSVDHGAVLRDLLSVTSIPRVELTRSYRTATESGIIQAAHAMLDGHPVELRGGVGDFRFVPVETQGDDATDAVLVELRRVVHALARKHGAATAEQVQVLTPRRTGPLGAVALNTILQAELNPQGTPGPEVAHEHVVRAGDKVIQRRNDYGACDEGLFNGEQGVVTAADAAADSVTVRFGPRRELTLRGAQLENLELAWAVTVHRSQGSEWPYVVMPYHELHEPMLDHAVLYTGLTRAKQLFALVGSASAVRTTCARPPQAHARVTGLCAQCAASGLTLARQEAA